MSWDSGFAVDLPNKLVATDTTLNPKESEPRRVMVARVDEKLAQVFEQITRVDEEIARAEEQLSKRDDAARHPSDPPQTRMNTFRPAVPGNRPSLGGRAVRGFAHARKPGASRAAEPGGHGEDSTSTTSTSGSDRAGRRRAHGRRPVARVDAIAPVDGARSRNRGAKNRAAQGQPGTNGPRQCEPRRATQDEPGTTNGPRHCHGFRADPAAQDTRASAAADSHGDAQAGVDAPVAESHGAAACRKNAVVIRAAGADAPALAPFIEGQTWENLLAFAAGTKAKCQPGLKPSGGDARLAIASSFLALFT